MPSNNPVEERQRDLAHCPAAFTTHVSHRARQANIDARNLAADIRTLDPREIWGRINRWGHDNPGRLLAAVVHLAALVDVDHVTTADTQWLQDIGGSAALHPDHKPTAPIKRRATTEARHAAILHLYRSTDLTQRAIAEQLGISVGSVERCLHIHNEPRRASAGTRQPDRPNHELEQRNQRIAHEYRLGVTKGTLATRYGLSFRAVERIIATTILDKDTAA